MLVNFSENTSVISFCTSADSGTDVKLTTPWLMFTCCPARLTVAIGASVVLSNRIYDPVVPSGSTRTWKLTVGGSGALGVGSARGISKSIPTKHAVPRMPMVATGVSTFMSPCFAVSPATKEMVPATRLSSDELFDPFGS